MYHTKVKMMTNDAGFIVIEPRGDIFKKYKVHADNEMVEVFAEKPFDMILSNLTITNEGLRNKWCSTTPARIRSLLYPSDGEVGHEKAQ